jgi:hypothetical protein
MKSPRSASLDAAAAADDAAASTAASQDRTNDESSSSIPAFTRPALTRKPSIRVKRGNVAGAPWEEEEGPRPDSPPQEDPGERRRHQPRRRQQISPGRVRPRCSPPLPPPRREMAIRVDRPVAAPTTKMMTTKTTSRKRSQLTTLCRPSLPLWKVLLLRGLPSKSARAQERVTGRHEARATSSSSSLGFKAQCRRQAQ